MQKPFISNTIKFCFLFCLVLRSNALGSKKREKRKKEIPSVMKNERNWTVKDDDDDLKEWKFLFVIYSGTTQEN